MDSINEDGFAIQLILGNTIIMYAWMIMCCCALYVVVKETDIWCVCVCVCVFSHTHTFHTHTHTHTHTMNPRTYAQTNAHLNSASTESLQEIRKLHLLPPIHQSEQSHTLIKLQTEFWCGGMNSWNFTKRLNTYFL